MKNRIFKIAVVVTAFIIFGTPVAAHFESGADVTQMTLAADFIFKGTVVDVQYRNSETVPLTDPDGNPVFDEDGNAVYVDGSDLPHTFVAYQVDQVYKGPRSSPSQLTLRFEGGHTGEADPLQRRYLVIAPFPLFDVGDRDILFVQGNTTKSCPLTKGQAGRLRLLQIPGGTGEPFVFSDRGLEIRVVVPPDGGPVMDWPVVYGPQHLVPEVTTYTIGDVQFEDVFVNPTEGILPPPEDNPQGIHYSESLFNEYLNNLVQELFTPEDLLNLPAVQNADISQSFFGQRIVDEPSPITYPPNPVEPARPWLDEVLTTEERDAVFEAERDEAEWFARTGGNSVLPQTECERNNLLYGVLPGDLSGPEGRPDCRVDLVDLGVLAANWLLCNDPDGDCL